MNFIELLGEELAGQVQAKIDAYNAEQKDGSKKVKFVDLSEGGYVSSEKYERVSGQINDLQTQIGQRDADMAELKTQLEAAAADGTKLTEAQQTLTNLQAQYTQDKESWEQKLRDQAWVTVGITTTMGGIGCSEYVRQALVKAGIILDAEYFHAGSGNRGALEDASRFQKLPWNPASLQKGDILWSQGHHVAVWAGNNSVWEAAPEATHPVATCGTGVGLHLNHGYYNCGNGTNTWSNIYRVIDVDQVKEDIQKEITMDKTFNAQTLAKYMPVIRYGATGDMVKALQTIMAKYGWYGGGIDGQCGPYTVEGIKLLQTALGVDVDGSFGPKSWTALLTL